jgi:multidrug efflux pump subunit AcrA (membrane-fusion protein)
MNDQNMRTLRTIILIALALAITAGGFLISKSAEEEKVSKAVVAPIKGVRVKAVELSSNFAKIEFSGKLKAEEKVDLYAEVSGVLLSNNFKEGVSFRKGEVLVSINSNELSNSLKASKSNLLTQVAASMGDIKIDFPKEGAAWEAFLNNINVDTRLPDLPALKDAKFKRFISGKGLLNTYYSVKSVEEKLLKFVLKAPFNGELVATSVKKGTLIRGGQKLGEFINPAFYELETEVSLSELKYVKPGYALKLHSDDLQTEWDGKVTRVNSTINSSSQMVKVYVSVKGSKLKEGMYLYGTSTGAVFENSFAINRKLVSNGGVYIVNDGVLSHKKVEVIYVNQSIAILGGLSKGDNVVADNVKGLFEGMKVTIIK